MTRQGFLVHRSLLIGLFLPIVLSGCFMNDPVETSTQNDNQPTDGDNSAPLISGNAPRVVKVGVPYSFTPQAVDPDGDYLYFAIRNKPMWATFDQSVGRISGVPQLGQEGTYNDIVISVSDGLMSTPLPEFSVSVEPSTAPNMPPEIDGTPESSVAVGDTYNFTPAGSDPDGDQLTYSIVNRPNWATFNATSGSLFGTPQASDIGTHGGISITVSDGTSTSSLPTFSISVVAANSAPQISGTPASSAAVGQNYLFMPNAFDPDGDALSYSISNRPGWATFSSATGQLSGTPQSGDEGTYTGIAISVSDGDLTASLPAFAIAVDATSGAIEVIVDNLDVNTSQTGTWMTSEGDNPYLGDSVFCNNPACTFSWQPNLPESGTYAVYAYWTYHENRSTTVPYRIDHNGGTGTTNVNQRDPALASRWNMLGVYDLTSGVNGTVTVSSENGQTSADAVRLVLIDTSAPDSMPPTDPNGLSVTAFSSNSINLAWSPSTDDVVVAGYYVYQNGNYATPATTVTNSSASITSLTPSTSYTFEVSAFDLAGNESGLSNGAIATTAAANSAPQISGSPAPSVDVGQSYSFMPVASDPDGDNLVYSIQNMPSWAQFDSTTGALSGTPQVGDEGTYSNISVSVSDGSLSDTLPSFTITVNQISMGSVTLDWVAPTENTDGSPLTDLAGYRIYYGTSPGNYTNQITINNPGVTSYVVDNLMPTTWHFVSTSFNSSGMESDYSNAISRTIN